MGLDEAAVNVGAPNATWIVVMTWISSGFGVILAALIAGKQQADMAEPLKMGCICMLLTPLIGIGWIMAMCIACKSKKQSEG